MEGGILLKEGTKVFPQDIIDYGFKFIGNGRWRNKRCTIEVRNCIVINVKEGKDDERVEEDDD